MTVVADTSALLALLDADDPGHSRVRETYELTSASWVFPGAILIEIDHLVAKRLGGQAHRQWLGDLRAGAYAVCWHNDRDLQMALALNSQYRNLGLGLVDGLVMATAERLHAEAIVTLDLRHFGAVQLASHPRLWPRDA